MPFYSHPDVLFQPALSLVTYLSIHTYIYLTACSSHKNAISNQTTVTLPPLSCQQCNGPFHFVLILRNLEGTAGDILRSEHIQTSLVVFEQVE